MIAPGNVPSSVDPNTGQPLRVDATSPSDVIITTSLPLRNVRLKDVLDAVVRLADKPIEYSLKDYGVVFSWKGSESGVSPDPMLDPMTGRRATLAVQTFQLTPAALLNGLESTFGIKVAGDPQPAVDKNAGKPGSKPLPAAREMQAALRLLFTQLGIDMGFSQKFVFYNEHTGVLMVRAAQDEMEVISAAIQTLSGFNPTEQNVPGSQRAGN